MSSAQETYVGDGLGGSFIVQELWTYDGLTSREAQELYVRNPLAPSGWDLLYTKPSGGGGPTVLDTYTLNGGQIWRAGNRWWNNIQGGTWTSTGTNSGTYIVVDSGSYIRDTVVRMGAPTGNVTSSMELEIVFSPAAAGIAPTLTLRVGGIGGDEGFNWVGGNESAANIGPGGLYGWDATDTITIRLLQP